MRHDGGQAGRSAQGRARGRVRCGTLPVQRTTFVGREAQLDEVLGLLASNRLVTLTGAGGAGKTRLALRLAELTASGSDRAVWFVDLSPVTTGAAVEEAVARAVELDEEISGSALDLVIRRTGTDPTLIVLDNCEHVVEAAAHAAHRLLGGCADLTILATSREPLLVEGEVTWRVPSLSLPTRGAEPAALAEVEALRLFVDRAARARPGFAVDAGNAELIAEICCRLDGIPLAIELAAALVRTLGLPRIAAGLDDRFRLLTGGDRTAVARHRTLRACVEWSHELLAAPDRALLRRLSVFAGAVDLEAIAAVSEVEAAAVPIAVARLVDRSLVLPVVRGDDTRYRLLETVRSFAREQLVAAGEDDLCCRRHRDHFLAVAERLGAGIALSAERAPIERLDLEMDDVRAALLWSLAAGDREAALRLAAAPFLLWWLRGRLGEASEWLDAALAAPGEVAPAPLARALVARSYFWTSMGEAGRSPGERAVAPARESGDRRLLARALLAAGRPGMSRPWSEVAPLLREATEIAAEVGDAWTEVDALAHLGIATMLAGRAGGRGMLESACEKADAAGLDVSLHSNRTLWVACMLIRHGDVRAVRPVAESLLGEVEREDDPRLVVPALLGYSWLEAIAGHGERALACAQRGRARAEEIAIPPFVALARCMAGLSALSCGDPELALAEFAAAAGCTAWPYFRDPFVALEVEAHLATGDLDAAGRLVESAVPRLRASGTRPALATLELAAARHAREAGDPAGAARRAYGALEEFTALENIGGELDAVELLAQLRAGARPGDSARLLAAAAARRAETDCARLRIHDRWYPDLVAHLCRSLGESAHRAATHEGEALAWPDALALARRGRPGRIRAVSGWASLTPAETAVALLAAEGLQNREIASRLHVSPRTVQTHLAHAYGKLEVSTRVQLARAVQGRGVRAPGA